MKKVLLTVFVLGLSLSVLAADPAKDPKMAEAMKAWEQAATPGPAHKAMTSMAGDWKYTSRWWMDAKATKPEETKGTSKLTAILGGRYIQQEAKGMAMGKPFEGHGIMGYDNAKSEYFNMWVDNMGTGSAQGRGTFDSATNTFKDTGVFTDPMTPSKTREYRSEWKMDGKNKHTYTMWIKGDDGKEYKSMEMVYTR